MEVVTLHPDNPSDKEPFCRTATAAMVASLLDRCHRRGEMGLIAGESGVGKSTALRHYAQGASGVYLATISPASGALVPALTRICEAMDTYPQNTGAMAARTAIVDRLSWGAKGHLLLIDECQHLGDDPIDEVRSLYDELRLAVVFCGARVFENRLKDKPSTRFRTWAQLTSRILHKLTLAGALPEDVAALCDHHAIAGKRSRELLEKAAARPGALRLVTGLIETARELAGPAHRIEFNHLKDAATVMGVAVNRGAGERSI